MKKVLCTLCAALSAMSLAACTRAPAPPSEPSPSTQAVTQPAPTTQPTQPATTAPVLPSGAMTETELASFRALFEADFSWYSQALTSFYDSPESVSFRELFYNGNLDRFTGGEQTAPPTDEELDAIRTIYGIEPDDFRTDCIAICTSDMEQVLQKLFGLGIGDTQKVGLDNWYYVPDTDRYFHFHGDTNAMTAQITDGRWISDQTAELHYSGGFDEECTVILTRQDDRWVIESNQTSQPQ